MKIKKLIKQITKVSFVFCLIFQLIATPIIPAFQTPITPKIAEATGESCGGGGGSPSGANLQARVGGVSLDQAATFLANMDDITGAYYDSTLDRIVFVGKKNTTLPEFDKDDLAVAIRAIIFKNILPAVSLENDPNNPNGPYQIPLYYGDLEDTKFGNVLINADYKMKKLAMGYDENQQIVSSSVPSYRSVLQRYIDKSPTTGQTYGSRFVIRPDLVSLKRDEAANAFVFDQVKMMLFTEPNHPNNDLKWNEAAAEFAEHHTDHYDEFAQEISEYADAKQLGKIVAVVKWLADNGIATDFNWAQEYEPKKVPTPDSLPRVTTPVVNGIGLTGGAEYYTPNTYNNDNGASAALKSASEAVNAPQEDIHWIFTKDGQAYESVAVEADAFRSFGSYSTSTTDMAFPTVGDLTLAFQRSYSSYSGGQNGIGRGWSFMPAQLVDNRPANPVWRASNSGDTYSHRYELAFSSPDSTRETFIYYNGTYFAEDTAYHSKITDERIDDTKILITVTTKNQTQYVFEELLGENISHFLSLIEIKDKNGNKITYNYDSSKRLSNVTDNKGHTITLTYNGDNLISSISDWSNRTINYSYDAQGNLLTVTDPGGNATSYTYDENNKLETITDREGKTVVENTYTPEAKLATQKNAANVTTTYTYDDVNKGITETDNLGRTGTTVYQNFDNAALVVEEIDAAGKSTTYVQSPVEYKPLSITDKNNNTTAFTYDANGNLASVTYPDLKKVTYQYDAFNRLTKITDERYGTPGRDTTNTYDGDGNLIEINKAGQITKFTYDAFGEALTATDPLNHTLTWTRDNFGNKLTEIDPLNKTTAFEYDAIARLTRQTDPDAKVVSYTYDGNGNVLTMTNAAGTTSNTYDKENRLIRTTLPNNSVTEYVYNDSGALNSVKDALANNTNYDYDTYQNLITQQDALNNTTTNIYDQLNRQTQSTTPLGKVAKWEYDANGNITKRIDENNKTTAYLYDALNRLTKITYPDAKTVTYTYDFRGNMTKMVDPIGTTTYTYDTLDRLLTVKNPYSRQITYTYDNANNLTKITYPDSRIVTYAYDNNNRLISAKDWNNQTTTYTYTDNGLLAGKTQPNGVVSSYSYDGANRLSNLEHIKSGTTLAKFAYERDSIGNITKVTEEGSFFSPAISPTPAPTSAPTPTPSSTPTPTPNGTEPDLVITSITTTPVSPSANTRFTVTISVKNQGSTPVVGKLLKIGYYYDLPQLPDYSTTYNDFNLPTVSVNAGETIQLDYAYVSFSSAGSHSIYALIDQENVLLETNEANNTAGPHNITVVPAVPTPTPTSGPTPTPTPASSQPDLVVSSITLNPSTIIADENFDISVKVKNQGTSATSTSFKVGIYYDRSSAPSASSYDDSQTQYDTVAVNQEITLTESMVDFANAGTHNIWVIVDREGSISEGNETNNVFGPYNVNVLALGPLDRLFALFRPFKVHAQQVYPQFVTNFTYDPLSRLQSASYPDTLVFSYTFDSVGNRLTQNLASPSGSFTLPYTYNNDNQLTNMGTNGVLNYDNNGNQTKITNSLGATSFLYNFENRLTKYTPPTGSSTTYTYDGNNNRLAKSVGSSVTRFVNDISGDLPRVLAETNSYNTIQKSYIYGNGLISQGGTSATSRDYYLEDGQGNVRFVTDEVGNKVRSTEYDPFGNWRKASGQSNIQMLYQGQQQDPESNLYYLRARYYDPATGRFISRDPIKGTLANPSSQNPYQYAYNNPINLGDPSGEQVAQALGIGAGAAFVCTLPISGTALVIGGAAIGVGIVTGYLLDQALHNPKQDHKLTEGEIKKLQEGGQDIESLKGGKNASKFDLFKDPKTGDIIVKPKNGAGPGNETGLNINDF